MNLARKNEEAAANLQKSQEDAANLQELEELNLQEPKESKRIERVKRMQWVVSKMQCVSRMF